jgi:DNA primase
VCSSDLNEEARRLAIQALAQEPAWFEHLGSFPALQALAGRKALDPMDVVEDPAQKALLAEALLAEVKPPEESEVLGAIQETQERAIEHRQRDLRTRIGEAEHRGDFTELALLSKQKAELDQVLRQLHNPKPQQR